MSDDTCPAREGDGVCGTPRPCPVHMPYQYEALNAQIDATHGPGAAAALEAAIADGSIYSDSSRLDSRAPDVIARDVAPPERQINRLADRHDPDEGCHTNAHCMSHNVDELDQPGDYRVCGECHHIFRTEQSLVDVAQIEWDAFRRSLDEEQREDMPVYVGAADTIHSCPLCTHDW